MCYFGRGTLAWEWYKPACKSRSTAGCVSMLTMHWSMQPQWPATTAPTFLCHLSAVYCEYLNASVHVGEVDVLLGSVIGFKLLASHVRNTLKGDIKCANDCGAKTLTVWVIADIMCNVISVADRAGRGTGPSLCLCGVWWCWNERQLWTALYIPPWCCLEY